MKSETQRSPVLGRLEALVGEWEVSINVEGGEIPGGRAVFEWIENGAFLVQQADADMTPGDVPPGWIENSPFPVVTIIGLDDTSERFSYLYSDGRGVSRVYEMSLSEREWRLRGQPGPEWFQRFTGRFSTDGRTIAGRWAQSDNGAGWELDFELTYRKIG